MRFKSKTHLGLLSFVCAMLITLLSFQVHAETKPVPRTEVLVCEGVDGEVLFEILFYISSLKAPAQAISMRVSDPNISARHSEVATFDAADGLLHGKGNVIVGYVDLENPKTGRKGERIGGTTLGALRSIMIRLDIDMDIASGSSKKQSAQAVYLKKTGEELIQDLDCALRK